MEAAMIKKMGIIAGILILTIVLAIGCNMIISRDKNPMVSNSDESFLSLGNVTITRGELYTYMKTSEGISHLLNHIDEIILEDAMNAIDAEAMEEELNLRKYGTTDPERIAEILEDEDLLERVEQTFYFSVIRAGFNPDEPEEVDRYLRLLAARRQSAINQLIEDFDEDVLETRAENFYNDSYFGDITAIELIFTSQEEFTDIMNQFQLVPGYEGGIGFYFGISKDIENMDEADFDDSNTRLLTEREVLNRFARIYNVLHPYRDALPESMQLDDTSYFNDDFIFNYQDMIAQARTANAASILFEDLLLDRLEVEANDDDDEDETSVMRYTNDAVRYNPEVDQFGHYYAMYFIVDQEDIPEYHELEEAEKQEIREAYAETLATDQAQIEHMIRLRYNEGFTLHDTRLKLSYELFVEGYIRNESDRYVRYEESDRDIIASLNDKRIQVDDYFDYMVRRIGAISSIELFKTEWLLQSEFFEARFGSNRDLVNSNNSDIVSFRRQIDNLAAQFGASIFAEDMSFEEFMFVYLQFSSDEDYLKYLVSSELLSDIVVPFMDFDVALEYVEDFYANYINLNVEHIVIYKDYDGDLAPDDFKAYLEALEAEGGEAWDTYIDTRNRLEDLIASRVEDGESLEDIVDEYRQSGRRESRSEWAEFKNFGFKLRYENLTADENQIVSYHNVFTFVPEYSDRLFDIYERYTRPEFVEDPFMVDPDGLFATQFGLHFIIASPGTEENFVQPSANFEDPDGDYDPRLINPGSVPTRDQLELWTQYQYEITFQDGSDINFPEDLDQVIQVYFDRYLGRLFPNVEENRDLHGNLVMIEKLLEGNVDFSSHQAHLIRMIEAYQELYRRDLFPDINRD